MNGIRCPKCDLVNLLTAEACHRCGASLSDLPQTAQVSVPVEKTFQAMSYGVKAGAGIPRDNETGRKTFLWYRIYTGFMALLYLAVAAMGLFLVFAGSTFEGQKPEDAIIAGVVYGSFGLLFGIVYAVATFLPRRPYNWIVGIVAIGVGLTSCCFLPATVPLLIFWLKPETKAYFGRE